MRERPDVVLLDLMLPEMSGVQILQEVRAQPELAQLPIVVFTNAYVERMVQEARDAGATKILTKAGYSPRQVVDIVSEVATAAAAGAPVADHVAEVLHDPAHGESAADLAGLKQVYESEIQKQIPFLRSCLQTLAKAEDVNARVERLRELYRPVHALKASAGMANAKLAAHVAEALEAFAGDMIRRPVEISASALRTLAQSVDFLARLAQTKSTALDAFDLRTAQVLTVDDDPISRRAVALALEKAGVRSVLSEAPEDALGLLNQHRFDLIILDVQMPGMNGFELCTKIRQVPQAKATPVLFVTAHSDFLNRARSRASGGEDLIGKPFLPMELTLKALFYCLRSRLA
jgi:CheY-like chemotaxis protein